MISTALDRLAAPPSSKLLGWHLLDARPTEGWVRIGFDGKAEFCNPAGFVQGGILSAMLDDTMGPAVFVMTQGEFYAVTITMSVNFLAPAKPGLIVGEADVTQLGKTIAFVEGWLVAEDGTFLATATASARLVETAKAIQAQIDSGPKRTSIWGRNDDCLGSQHCLDGSNMAGARMYPAQTCCAQRS